MTTVLKNMTFADLYDQANMQRPMTLSEYAHAQDMFDEFGKLLTEFRAKSNKLSDFMNYVRHINSCGVRTYEEEQDWAEEYADIEFNTGDELVEYILVTVRVDETSHQLYLLDTYDVAIPHQDYEYECITPEEKPVVLRTRDEITQDITGDVAPVQHVLFNVKFPQSDFYVIKNYDYLLELANLLITKTQEDITLFANHDKQKVFDFLAKYNIEIQDV